MRRRGIVLVVLGIVGAGFLFVGSGAAEAMIRVHRESQFNGYWHTYLPGWGSSASPGVPQRDRAWTREHPDAVLAEGYAACAWLAAQPQVPDLVPSGAATVDAMARRYQGATAASTNVDIDERSRSTIVVGAWAYLCPGTRDSRTSSQSASDD
jgi:hypothetical protein